VRYLAAAAASAVMVLALAGCDTDDRRCLESHTDLMPITMVNAQGQPYITWVPADVCDKYEDTK
jgi:hypothetical protein